MLHRARLRSNNNTSRFPMLTWSGSWGMEEGLVCNDTHSEPGRGRLGSKHDIKGCHAASIRHEQAGRVDRREV